MLALRHMTTFRVPTAVHQEVCELLKLLAETPPQDDNSDDDNSGGGGGRNQNQIAGYLRHVIQRFQEGGGARVNNPSGAGENKLNSHEEQEESEEPWIG